MFFFFVKDHREKYRYFCTKPLREIQVKFSRWKKIWEKAKKKLMLLPQRILAQEQAFEHVLKLEAKTLVVLHSGRCTDQKIKIRFFFFLQRQRTKHVFLLIAETLLLPISGLAALLPGPNVFFGVLALLMFTHWQSLRGINRLLKKDHDFRSSQELNEWEEAIKTRQENAYPQILKRIAEEYKVENIHKILWS